MRTVRRGYYESSPSRDPARPRHRVSHAVAAVVGRRPTVLSCPCRNWGYVATGWDFGFLCSADAPAASGLALSSGLPAQRALD